ncbi:MAG: WbuC family cupin fold metalloprotein [Burkholderiales bacterium]|nr:WbuC family cupin fold metalloprotein [Burkholderiales bacterium]MDE2287492.1 WbuC family cupin fold metalloprotein [Burkholderiales bacterium]
MKTLPPDQLDVLTDAARRSPRLRMNHNLHAELSDPIQRLAIAMEPGTYIRPHRHRHTWELLLPLRGRFAVLEFDEQGAVAGRTTLGAGAAVVETPPDTLHTVVSLDDGGVIFEVKHGPYRPFVDADYAPWSAEADTPQAEAFMAWCRTAAVGDRWPA